MKHACLMKDVWMMIVVILVIIFAAPVTVSGEWVTSFDSDTVPTGNPVIRHKYTADPAALVYNGKVYLYTGHDEAPPRREAYIMHEWLCFSSDDMVNWQEHPSPLNVKAFGWAKDDAWAGQVVYRNNKFYWYVAITHN